MIDGILLINKGKGRTSHDLVSAVRKKFSQKRVGHAGTLDPIATGLLIMGINKGTRILEYLVGLDKTYEVEAMLGKKSDTYDLEGQIVTEWEGKRELNKISEQEIIDALNSFRGTIKQRPPNYSAIKISGIPAYKLARKGEEVAIAFREVTIRDIYDIKINQEIVRFKADVSSGTYIRSLVFDLGEKLGCGALMSNLNRSVVGAYNLARGKSIDEVDEKDIMSTSDVIRDILPNYNCSSEEEELLKHGLKIQIAEELEGKDIAVFYNDRLIALCSFDYEQKILKPRKVFLD